MSKLHYSITNKSPLGEKHVNISFYVNTWVQSEEEVSVFNPTSGRGSKGFKEEVMCNVILPWE